ncbi:phage protein Gp27 family protein [Citreimonas salinaria]|uniref:DUF3486 family protein n=1 Tax=Citreimonas salinaria TaxID=321339 RepID=A0A1H3KT07_9RHOB|nr:phage protein Gp27 family protein [Citreimonas salinaria]SDY55146.1 Protein of unknown function [Citreimonas salinaria]
MPAPAKLDLIPPELRQWLAEELAQRGFGDIVDVTEALNFRLEEAGLEVSVGKSAVGRFSKALKDQREAFAMAETLLSDLDIEAEGELHRVLMQMIATSAVHMMQSVREEDGHLEPKDLMALGRMLKDLMASSGMREKLLEDERRRVAREAREAAQAEMAENLEKLEGEQGLSPEMFAAIRSKVLGLKK